MTDRIRWPYASEGTLFGTIHQYDTEGNDLGAQDLSSYGVYFALKDGYDPGAKEILRKEIGVGLTITAGTSGLFEVHFNSRDVKWPPKEYLYGVWINSAGTAFYPGTTSLKSVGSGIFEIREGVQYGTV